MDVVEGRWVVGPVLVCHIWCRYVAVDAPAARVDEERLGIVFSEGFEEPERSLRVAFEVLARVVDGLEGRDLGRAVDHYVRLGDVFSREGPNVLDHQLDVRRQV